MKVLLFAFFLLLWGESHAQAQCSCDKYTQKGIKMLSQDHEGFTYLKTYEVTAAEGKKYSYIFTQGTNYLFTLANNDTQSKGFFVSIYDSNDKLITTSYLNGKFYSTIQFSCKGTGVYQLRFGFEGTSDHCASAVLGMKR